MHDSRADRAGSGTFVGADPSAEVRGLLDAAMDAGVTLWSLDLVTATVERRSRDLGGGAPEVKTLAEVLAAIHPEDAGAFRGALDRLLEGGGTEHVEVRIARGNEVAWLSVHARVLEDPRARRVVAVTRDITEERSLERRLVGALAETARTSDELRESRSTAAYSQQLAAVGTFEILLAEVDPLRGATVQMGEGSSRILGLPGVATLSLEEAFGMIHPEDLPAVRATVVVALSSGQSFVTQARLVRGDGSVRFVRAMAKLANAEGGGGRFVGAVHDATDWFETDQRERARAAALATSEATLRAILASSLDTVVMIDERGTIEQVNPTVTRMFGFTVDELVGLNVKVLMPPHDRARHDEYLARYLETGTKHIIGIGREVVCLRKDGTTFLAELSVTEFFVAGRRHYAGVLHDITERRRTDLEVANAELRVRTSLAYDLHDLVGQHLAGARMLMGNLRSDAPQHLQPRVTRIKELLRDAVEHVRAMSRELAAMDIIEAPLPDALRAVGANLRPLFGPTIRVDAEEGFVDPPAEEKVHAFLLTREAMLNAAKHAKASTITVMLQYECPWYSISVVDDGKGIDRAAACGIGLSSMRYRARLLGGHTEVVPLEAGGTAVLLRWSTPAGGVSP